VELDLGATAKALAADRAVRSVHEATGVGALVSLGGDIAVAGEPPGQGWPVRIADDSAAPLDSAGPSVLLTAGGLATSGTAVRRWKTSAGELHHLVDPRTGRPAASFWRTATVTAASCVDANTASTAAVVLGEEALRWLATIGLPARLVRYDDAVSRVAGWPEAA
jgi:thiamine biosynthesis lipoprotein